MSKPVKSRSCQESAGGAARKLRRGDAEAVATKREEPPAVAVREKAKSRLDASLESAAPLRERCEPPGC